MLLVRHLRYALLFGLAAGWLVLGAEAVSAATDAFTVTKTEDTADGACDDDCSLREAIIAANADPGESTISVPAGAYLITIAGQDNAGQSGDFDITSGVTITGAGADQTIVDGNAIDTVFHVISPGEAEIRDLTIEGGDGSGDVFTGVGGIYANGDLALDGVNVVRNTGGPEGAGGVYSDQRLTIKDSLIDSNTSVDPGTGGLYAAGGAEIEDTTISNNTAMGTSSAGGAVILGEAELSDVTLTGNTAAGQRSTGGLYLALSDATQLQRVRVADNAASGDFAVGGAWIAAEVTATDVVVDANSGGHFGEGGLFIECCGGALDLTNATISNNTAPGDSGGGAWNDGEANFANVTISGNSAGADSTGGLYNSGEMTLVYATIADNTALDPGAGGLWNDGELTVTNSVVAGNSPGECKLGAGNLTSGGGNVDTGDTCAFHAATDQANGGDAMLAPLADNGGFGKTHRLLAGSPAVDAANGCPPPAFDERGLPRPVGGGCDSGAFELGIAKQKVWGDTDCGADVDTNDFMTVMAHVAQVPGEPAGCSPAIGQAASVNGAALTWGDVDCDGAVDTLDVLYMARWAVGLEVTPRAACPELGQQVDVN